MDRLRQIPSYVTKLAIVARLISLFSAYAGRARRFEPRVASTTDALKREGRESAPRFSGAWSG
jgi:hypothetical protein